MNTIIKTWTRDDGETISLFLRDTGPRAAFSIGDPDERTWDYESFLVYKEKLFLPPENFVTQKGHFITHKGPKIAAQLDQALDLYHRRIEQLTEHPVYPRSLDMEYRDLAETFPQEASIVTEGIYLNRVSKSSYRAPEEIWERHDPLHMCFHLGLMCSIPFPLLKLIRFFNHEPLTA